MKKWILFLLALLLLTSFTACKVAVESDVPSSSPAPESSHPQGDPSPVPSDYDQTASDEPSERVDLPSDTIVFDTELGFSLTCPADYETEISEGMAVLGKNTQSAEEMDAILAMKSPTYVSDLNALTTEAFEAGLATVGVATEKGAVTRKTINGFDMVSMRALMNVENTDVVVEYLYFNLGEETLIVVAMVGGTSFDKLDTYHEIMQTIEKT